jgi:thiol-disulfide isomerase/thioredoxin
VKGAAVMMKITARVTLAAVTAVTLAAGVWALAVRRTAPLAAGAPAAAPPPLAPSPAAGISIRGKLIYPKGLNDRNRTADPPSLRQPVHLPQVQLPANVLQITPAERLGWYNRWEQTDEGRRHLAMQLAAKERRDCQLIEDEPFHFEGVPAGEYYLEAHFYGKGPLGFPDHSNQLASAAYDITVAPRNGADDGVRELGELTARPLELVNAGQMAPDIVIPMLDGTDVRLSDYRGELVLLDFWGTWCGQCLAQLPDPNAIYQAYGKDGKEPRFVMISLSVGDTRAALEKAVREEAMAWKQSLLGSVEEAWQAKLFSVPGYPTYWLIGPDGRVIAEGWQAAGIRPYIEVSLKGMRKVDSRASRDRPNGM